jgi:hypothetical protein
MGDRWRRELRRLSALEPDDDLLSRAHEGPRRDLDEGPRGSKILVVSVALAVFGAAGVLTLQAFAPGSGPRLAPQPGYPSPPASGYYVLFPDQDSVRAEGGDGSRATLTAITNLPEDTLLSISGGDEGTCCPPVKDGGIVVTAGNQTCYGPVGDAANSPGFDVEITARPDTDSLIYPGPISGSSSGPKQPPSVLDVLGPNFETLTGDQVVEQEDGSKWLVAKARYQWPEPQCGGDPIPLFGGPDCQPSQEQLQSDTLDGAMVDVMGAIGQGRMCEFWGVMLPPDVEEQHPWASFADEWRPWLLQQDFSDSQPSGDWTTGPLRWQEVGACHGPGAGQCHIIDVVHDDQRIATLQLAPLPDYCPDCSANVVPFWGVIGWTLYPSGDGGSPSLDGSSG